MFKIEFNPPVVYDKNQLVHSIELISKELTSREDKAFLLNNTIPITVLRAKDILYEVLPLSLDPTYAKVIRELERTPIVCPEIESPDYFVGNYYFSSGELALREHYEGELFFSTSYSPNQFPY